MLWRYDPDPAATVGIQSQINAALAGRSIVLAAAASRQAGQYYYCCPWSSIYLVRRPVTIAGQRLRQMQQFTFDVSAEEMAEGGQFVRRLLPGPFHLTSEVTTAIPPPKATTRPPTGVLSPSLTGSRRSNHRNRMVVKSVV
jgi:hypothetical protein